MAQKHLDTHNQESVDVTLGKIEDNFTDLYNNGLGATPSVTTLTTSGNATVGGNLAVTGTTALTGNATAAGTLGVTGQVTAGGLALDTGTKTATATAGAATLNKDAGVITSEGLTTAAAATYTLTITNSSIAAADQVFASVQNGTNSQGTPVITTVTPGSGSVAIIVKNDHATDAFNGTIKIAFMVLKN